MSSNLPPGVTDSMLPGNTEQDLAWEGFCEALSEVVPNLDEATFTKLARWIEDCVQRACRAGYDEGYAQRRDMEEED